MALNLAFPAIAYRPGRMPIGAFRELQYERLCNKVTGPNVFD